jgi:hypothetical protein
MSMVVVLLVLLCSLGLIVGCSWSVTVGADESQRTLEALAEENVEQSTRISDQATWISHLATRVGAAVATPVWIMMPTPTPPVSGYVEIEDGRCCIGGTAGSTVEVRVSFWASSPFAEVTEMRVRTGGRWFDEADMVQAPWEPYVEGRIYPVTLVVNWIGFYVSVQFRDALGNLSPIFTDDISVEGMPLLTPTPYPTPYG